MTTNIILFVHITVLPNGCNSAATSPQLSRPYVRSRSTITVTSSMVKSIIQRARMVVVSRISDWGLEVFTTNISSQWSDEKNNHNAFFQRHCDHQDHTGSPWYS
jgi:hypothetical protein